MGKSLAVSLILTLALETGFFLLIGKRNKKDLSLVVLVNILTNPVVVSLYWLALQYTAVDRIITTVLLELFAVLTEGFCYNMFGKDFRYPYFFSAAANVFSFGIGLILQRIF